MQNAAGLDTIYDMMTMILVAAVHIRQASSDSDVALELLELYVQ